MDILWFPCGYFARFRLEICSDVVSHDLSMKMYQNFNKNWIKNAAIWKNHSYLFLYLICISFFFFLMHWWPWVYNMRIRTAIRRKEKIYSKCMPGSRWGLKWSLTEKQVQLNKKSWNWQDKYVKTEVLDNVQVKISTSCKVGNVRQG
jgi:hypothetical protein